MTHPALLLSLLLACGGTQKNTPESPSDDAANKEPAEEPAPEPAPAEGELTPAKLYEQCLDRVEQPQAEGECETDADCKAAGCSGEVCTTVTQAADIMTSCEGKRCFSILETCGCQEGQCTWNLKDEVPPAQKLPKPPGEGGPANALPPTKPAPAPEGDGDDAGAEDGDAEDGAEGDAPE